MENAKFSPSDSKIKLMLNSVANVSELTEDEKSRNKVFRLVSVRQFASLECSISCCCWFAIWKRNNWVSFSAILFTSFAYLCHFHAKCLTFAIYILRNNTLEAYTYTYTAVDWCAAAKKKPQWNHSNVWFIRKWYHHANKNTLNSIWFGWIKFATVLRLNI